MRLLSVCARWRGFDLVDEQFLDETIEFFIVNQGSTIIFPSTKDSTRQALKAPQISGHTMAEVHPWCSDGHTRYLTAARPVRVDMQGAMPPAMRYCGIPVCYWRTNCGIAILSAKGPSQVRQTIPAVMHWNAQTSGCIRPNGMVGIDLNSIPTHR